jgi:dihydroorotate dehydrogenase
MLLYDKLLKPLLFSLDPETAHELVCSFLPAFTAAISNEHNPFVYKSPRLKTNLLGLTLNSPLGLAAGFDKNGIYTHALAKLGFSFIEIGSVQAVATDGNPRPRLFRLPEDHALINRLGLNGQGAEAVVQRLISTDCPVPLGINISKTNDAKLIGDAAVEDVLHTFRALLPLPVAYITINISCPNTEEGRLQEIKESTMVLEEVQKINTRQLPVLVKLSPDSPNDMLEALVGSSIKNGIKGYICGNTTVRRDILRTAPNVVSNIGSGGVSGRPLKALILELIRKVRKLKAPEQIIIGVGGVFSGHDVLDFLNSGAAAVQAYTGFVYKGPTFCKNVCQELDSLLASRELSVSSLTSSVLGI